MFERRLTFPSLLSRCGLLAAALVIYHLLLRWLMLQGGLRLGTISHKLAPLYAYWRPHFKGWLLIPLAVLVGYFAVLRRTRVATSMTDRAAIGFFQATFTAIAVSVAMLDAGPRSLIGPLLRRDLEYYGAVDRVHGVTEFLRDYPQLASTMPMHAQVHPPGAVLFVSAACKLLGGGPWAAAAGIILFSSLAVPLVYLWANRLGGPGVARRAAAIFVLTPSAVLFTATSMDGPFAVFLIATMWLFWEAIKSQSKASLSFRAAVFGLLAGLAAATAALMTYSVTVALLFCGVATLISWISRPDRRRATLLAAAAALLGFVALHAVLWLCTGYDPIQMFLAAVANSNHIMTGTRHESPIRYAHIVVGNLVVFFIAAGLPCAVLWWSSIVGPVRDWLLTNLFSILRSSPVTRHSSPVTGHSSPVTDPSALGCDLRLPTSATFRCFAVTACVTLLIAASVPVYVLEVERVWMFLIPLVVIPVAVRLFAQEQHTGRLGGTLAVCTLTAIQTVLTEVLLTTYW